MRLTLRTLLAWLDDTLPPEEVREIGVQVSETPYAQQLVERIRKVTRRRRLTVPPNTGPEGVDPNLVAAYLDNELEADRVAELEKRCLASDVHLAEVASCHQILSLIKNKAKVPPESRYRMYRLFKGPEAVRTSYKGAAPPGDRGLLGTNEMAGIDAPGDGQPPWAGASPPRPSTFERLGPPLVAVALIAALTLVGLLNLRSADVQVRQYDTDLAGNRRVPLDPEEGGAEDGEVVEGAEEAAPLVPAPPIRDERPAEPDADVDPDAGPDPDGGPAPGPNPAAPLPDGVAAVLEQVDGVALGATPMGATWDWQPHGAGDPLVVGELVVNLFPFRSTLGFGAVHVTMVGQADLRIAEPRAGLDARFDLVDGDVVFRADEPGATVGVGFEGRMLAVEPPTGQPVGLSWIGDRAPGEPAGRPLLGIWAPSGTLRVTPGGLGGEPRTFDGPVEVRFDPKAGTLDAEAAVTPDWVADPGPSPAEEQLGESFAPLFEQFPGSITFALLEGLQGDDPDIQAAAVAALGAMSTVEPANLEQVMPLLNQVNAPSLRSSAIDVLRRRISRGPAAAEEVLDLLGRFTDPAEEADELGLLLVGLGPDDRSDPDRVAGLVADLSSPNPSVRQLAIEALRALTGREALGYDPDQPEGPGLKAWQDLLRSGRLSP
ncbi:hypothetical protein [Tautonia plasticadhaerens]|uniref:HEAT repeat protein n=1 Tax=Tautonia plasticadhaerens TaxID=2527974 RepID=A0A518H034_9BACT|nr:hypothetical protein [Tautonia plasticadhaerens]QDV34196.1 hypothetical protein ElP_20810 [Tautonia plasticadhaerens]